MRQVRLDIICDTLEILRADGLLTTANVHILACGVAQQLALEVRKAGTRLSVCVESTCVHAVSHVHVPKPLAGATDTPIRVHSVESFHCRIDSASQH